MNDREVLMRRIGITEDTSVSERMVNLVFLYCELFSLMGAIVLSNGDGVTYLGRVCVAYMAVMACLWIFARLSGHYGLVSNIIVYLTDLVFLPALFICSMGMFGGTPVLFVGGFILAFILLGGVRLLVSLVLISMWDIFVMAFAYYYPERLVYVGENWDLIRHLIFAFVTISILAVMSLALYAGVYRHLKRLIEESRRFIEMTGEVKSKFLANTTGELRTPMNAIITMTELLERNEGNEHISAELGMIKESAFSLLGMINNVLTYSALDAGTVELANHQFHFSTVLKDLIYTVSMELTDKNVSLYTQIDPAIPDVLYGDVSKVRQVFKYILNNSVRSTQDGRIIMEVGFEKQPRRSNIRINVRISDTGPGFTEDEKAAVFNSFEIYDSKKYSQLKKIGLEMNICRELLMLMNGNISIDSINGVGTSTSFYFEIFSADRVPIVDTKDMSRERSLVYVPSREKSNFWLNTMGLFGVVPDITESYVGFISRLKSNSYDHIFVYDSLYEKVAGHIGAYECDNKCYIISDYRHKFGDFGDCRILRTPISCINLSEALYNTWLSSDYLGTISESSFTAPKAKVLIVDNNMLDLHMVSGILDRFEINSSIATSGREALDKCSRQFYDLIMLNQNMPVMDGMETLRGIRRLADERYSTVPIICMTSSMKYDAKEKLMSSGFQDLLAKPVRRAPLEAILRNYLRDELIEEREENTEGSQSEGESGAVSGLSVDTGLLHSGGDEKVYCDILNTYYREGEPRIADILGQYEAGDMEMFTINVHAVKGSSAGIGGREVSELFKKLEFAGKDRDLDYISGNLNHAIDRYRDLLEEIKDYLISKDSFENDNDMVIGEVVPFDIESMKEFKTFCEDFDSPGLEALLDRWKGKNYGEEMNSYISRIRLACDSFEYDTAIELAEEFIEAFG